MDDTRGSLGIYIDLDSILDTRLGTIAKHNKKDAVTLIEDVNYYTRIIDEFPQIGMTFKDFRRLYNKRDVEVLKESLMSNMGAILRDIVIDAMTKMDTQPFYKEIIIYLNIYPYQLSEKEQIEIGKALHVYVGDFPAIKMIYKKPYEVSPKWIADNILLVFMYDGTIWLQLISAYFAKMRIPDVSIYMPAIFLTRTPTEKEYKELEVDYDGKYDNYFQMYSDVGKMIIDMEYLPIDHYCIENNVYQELIDKEKKKDNEKKE